MTPPGARPRVKPAEYLDGSSGRSGQRRAVESCITCRAWSGMSTQARYVRASTIDCQRTNTRRGNAAPITGIPPTPTRLQPRADSVPSSGWEVDAPPGIDPLDQLAMHIFNGGGFNPHGHVGPCGDAQLPPACMGVACS